MCLINGQNKNIHENHIEFNLLIISVKNVKMLNIT